MDDEVAHLYSEAIRLHGNSSTWRVDDPRFQQQDKEPTDFL